MTDSLQILVNPWNAVVALVAIVGLETLKYTLPEFFADGSRGNRLLRLMCVTACALGYLIPGPWALDDTPWHLRLFVGALVGGVTTVGYGLFADAFHFVKKRDVEAKTADAWLDVAKKLGAVVTGLFLAASGVYGAWLRPETKAKTAYELTAEGLETLSKDVADLAHGIREMELRLTAMDKTTAVDLALLKQDVKNIHDRMNRRLRHRGEPEMIREAAVVEPTVVVERTEETVDFARLPDADEKKKGPQIQRQGHVIQMPKAKEVF